MAKCGLRYPIFNKKFNKNKFMRTREISSALRKVFLKGGSMSLSLYQKELAEHIDEWYEELKQDQENLAYVVTEKDGDVAMLIIDQDKNIYVNEDARAKLAVVWAKNYINNMNLLLPSIVDRIDEYGLAIDGIMIMKRNNRSKAIGMGRKWVN
jgi:hypothetical protein